MKTKQIQIVSLQNTMPHYLIYYEKNLVGFIKQSKEKKKLKTIQERKIRINKRS